MALTRGRKVALWVLAGLVSVAVFPLGILGAALTKGYNEDFCFSTRVDPPEGWAGVEQRSSYMSRTVHCHYRLQDGRTQTETYEVGTYTFWVMITLAFGAPLAYLAALLVAGLVWAKRSLANR